MGSIGRYIFRTTFGAFLVICASVTALMWITQALRDIDLMTNQGQSIFVFIGITGLIIPLLVLIIAPIALMIAVAHVLNKLGNDLLCPIINNPSSHLRQFRHLRLRLWSVSPCRLGRENIVHVRGTSSTGLPHRLLLGFVF